MSEVIRPPNRLAEHAVKGRGPDLETIVDRVQSGIEAMAQDYEKELADELSLMDQSMATVRMATGAARAEAMARLYRIAHDTRGLAGSFGYPLLAAVATSLCSFIDRVGEGANGHLDVIACHVDAMRAVLAGGIRGDGGAAGKELLEGMEALVAKSETPS